MRDRLDKRLLRHILDLGVVAHEARQQPPKLALVFFDQLLEGFFVAGLCALDQHLVNFAFVHAL